MRRLKPWGLFAALILLLAALPAPGQLTTAAGPWRSFSVSFENDLLAGTDRHYTNGLRLSWLAAGRAAAELPVWARALHGLLPVRPDADAAASFGFAFGHSIYTPTDTNTRLLVPDDVPYAGWLYFAGSVQSRRADQIQNLELSIGMVGPSAMGEQAQNSVHRLRHLDTAKGWRHQLKDEPGLLLNYEIRRRWRATAAAGSFGWEAIPHCALAAGNIQTHAQAGLACRIGWRLPDNFQAGGNRPSNYATVGGAAAGTSVFIFANSAGRWVGRNIFIDGNSFRDSHGVDRIPWVGEVEIGLGISRGRWALSLSQVRRSREFHGQDAGHRYGSLTLAVAL